jgi:hypothetical protein
MYITGDFYSAVVLRTYGFTLTGIEPDRPGSKRMNFVFDSSNSKESPEEIIRLHWENELHLPTRKFVDSINELKTRVYDK